MALKVSGSDGKEYIYNVSKNDGYLDATRVKFGKGRNMVYWQFEITNNGLSTFDLDGAKIYHILGTRISNA